MPRRIAPATRRPAESRGHRLVQVPWLASSSGGAASDRPSPRVVARLNARGHSSGRSQRKELVLDSDRVEGKVKETEGEVQQKWGEAKDKARDAWDDVKDKADEIGDDAEDRVDEKDDELTGPETR